MRILLLAMILTSLIVAPISARADSAGTNKLPKMVLTGTAFFRYVETFQEPGSSERDGSFELWRLYTGLKATLTKRLKAKFLADVGPVKGSDDDAYRLFVKYAQLDLALGHSMSLRFGVIGNPYHSFTDKFWGNRFVSKNIGDELKLWNSADLGVTLMGELPSGLGEVAAGVVNGAGYKHALDTDAEKSLWLYAAVKPLAPLSPVLGRLLLGGFLEMPITSLGGEGERLLISGLLGYGGEVITAGVQSLAARYASGGHASWGLGGGVYFNISLPYHVGILSRVLLWTPPESQSGAGTSIKVLAGLSRSFNKFFSVALSAQASWETDPAPEDEGYTVKALISSMIKF